jgi:hypothetical protein
VRLGLAAFALALLAVAPARAAGPTLAVEDTLRTEVPEVLVRAPRVTLDEILDRVARGEARRDSAIRDQAFTLTARIVRNTGDPRKPDELVSERVLRAYRKRPDRSRAVVLRRWDIKPEDAERGRGVRIEIGTDMSEEIVNFAFRPEARRNYRYRIVGRDLIGERLVYRIGFEPRSTLDPSQPSGLVWVDTNEFVIVRQEVSFERSPVPIILRGVDRMVIERGLASGVWVLKRVLLRARTTIPLPTLGRSFDIAIRFDDYAINRGIDDAVFAGDGVGR